MKKKGSIHSVRDNVLVVFKPSGGKTTLRKKN